MAEESLRAQNQPRKQLIFPGFFDQMAVKPTDFGHNLQPYQRNKVWKALATARLSFASCSATSHPVYQNDFYTPFSGDLFSKSFQV